MPDFVNLLRGANAILKENILPFWLEKMTDTENGGFWGRIDGEGVIHPSAEKGAVLNTRILWSFAAAYRVTGDVSYRDAAFRAKKYLLDHFYDEEFGGVYWTVTAEGQPGVTKKQIYALGFAVYGLSELYRATGDTESLEYAIRLFHTLEEYSFDRDKNGYFEAFTRDWKEIRDMRLSEKDANEKKTMNTHLHILEPYTNLYRVWKDEELKGKLSNLVELFLDRIIDSETGHLRLFFDEDWNSKCDVFSYGHDIEASWLLYEAADVLGDYALSDRVKQVLPAILGASAEGLRADGSLVYEKEGRAGEVDEERHWWVQAESVVGFLNAYQVLGDLKYADISRAAYRYIEEHLLDMESGEWYWSILPDGTVNRKEDKAGLWKCPYHNARMCLEVMERLTERQ